MKEYKMFVGMDGMKLWNATIEYEINPSEENKRKLDLVNQEISDGIQKRKKLVTSTMENIYGKDIVDFILSIKGKIPFNVNERIRWDVKEDYDNEEYWAVVFDNGKFHYINDHASGYGGTTYLERNITKERVLELLNK